MIGDVGEEEPQDGEAVGVGIVGHAARDILLKLGKDSVADLFGEIVDVSIMQVEGASRDAAVVDNLRDRYFLER